MSILKTITSSEVKTDGLRIVIAGQEKMGKTTLVCGAPNALLVPLEVGYSGVTTPKVAMLQTYKQVIDFLLEVTYYAERKQFPYKSIVFDSATALERHIHDSILMMDPAYARNKNQVTMESALGGYGKAYQLANEAFIDFMRRCDILAVNCGINIVLTCHVFAAKLIDPQQGEYDSWDLLLHSPKNQKTYGKRELITQWADIIGFLHEPIFIARTEEKVGIAVSANRGRVLGLSRTPGYTAGNRFGINGDVPIPLINGWNALATEVGKTRGIDIFNKAVQATSETPSKVAF